MRHESAGNLHIMHTYSFSSAKAVAFSGIGHNLKWRFSTKEKPAPEPEIDPSPPTDSTNPAPASSFETGVFNLVNEYRIENGKPALESDAHLNAAADKHSLDMATNNFMSHTGSNGSSVGQRVSAEGYDWRSVGENVAAGQTSPQKVVDAWIDSPGHRNNLLGNWDDLGVGHEPGGSYGHYWTTVFASDFELA